MAMNVGHGTGGHIINGVLVSAAAPVATPGVATGIIEIWDCTILTVQLVVSAFTGAFTGNWKIEGSNNYAPSAGGGNLGQPPNAGDWDDLTAVFSDAVQPTPAPTVAAVTANGNQLVFSPPHGCGFRALRVSVTRTGGTSIVADVWVVGKR